MSEDDRKKEEVKAATEQIEIIEKDKRQASKDKKKKRNLTDRKEIIEHANKIANKVGEGDCRSRS